MEPRRARGGALGGDWRHEDAENKTEARGAPETPGGAVAQHTRLATARYAWSLSSHTLLAGAAAGGLVTGRDGEEAAGAGAEKEETGPPTGDLGAAR
eukprot:CAMPEP_0206002214 /NCGR_PEP_ID=MMETSP1464-20131121/2602_1 /ASSEMBLY_ACC=CAM_ASM_001124 /TAXON_ID=119497 /ORGANISM="Exanthemachrysis gayraliae, Strain RCC1523" /LENGTH=96 /DNA_ID=CAMNT_0053375551 /DNA_START=251 /DNA_END=540 /DNA_ORIENTATION=-